MGPRKAHLKRLADLKRSREEAADTRDVDYEPEADDGDAEARAEALAGAANDLPGASAHRVRKAADQRRSRKFLRGTGPLAQSMQTWLSMGKTQWVLDDEAIKEVAARALELAAAAVADEEEEERQAAATAAKRQQMQNRRMEAKQANSERRSTPPPRVVKPRLSRTFTAATGSTTTSKHDSTNIDKAGQKRARPNLGSVRKLRLQKRRVVTPELESAIQRISKARAFKRSDIIGGKELNRIEWAHASRDYKELRKVYAMNVFIKCRREGTPARKAYEKAAQTVGRANGNHVNWQTVRGWVMVFAQMQGKLRLDQRGRHAKTKSYLDDPAIKEQAIEWLRLQLKQLRQKNVDRCPLTRDSFLD